MQEQAHQNAHDQKLCMVGEKSAHERLRLHALFKDYDRTPAAEELPQDGPGKSQGLPLPKGVASLPTYGVVPTNIARY